jgi:UDP-glucose 4-epimerase
MQVLVTGSGGFIGSAVKEHLVAQGHEPVPYDLVDGNDIKDAARVLNVSKGCDAVIHLAGVLGTHELFDTINLAIDVNIKGTVNVLEAARANDLRYVGISMPPVFKSIYTATKVCTGWIASGFHETFGVPVSHVRAYNAFGPGQHHGPGHPQKIVPTFAVETWAGRPVPVWGSGNQTVDLIHTTDLARMLAQAINFGDDDTFDGGTGKAFTVNEVVKMVADIVGVEPQIEYKPMRRGEKETDIVATGLGWDKLGWQPKFNYQQLVDAVNSYKDHPSV